MGIAERKEREKEMRRKSILEAAGVVFFEKGLRAATLDEIAEKAEVSKGTIYLYFSSKEDLYCSLMTKGLLMLLETFRQSNPDESDPTGAIRLFGEAYLQFSRQHSHLFKMLAAVENPAIADHVSPEVFAALEQSSDDVLSYVATFVQRGIDTGIFRRDISAHEAVVLFWVSLSGLLNLRERSYTMRKDNVLKADSIIGSVDFDCLYGKCQEYLLNSLAPVDGGSGSERGLPSDSKAAGKQTRAARRR